MTKIQSLMTEVAIRSSLDGSMENVLLYMPPSDQPVPLLVGLHTWSTDLFNQIHDMLPLVQHRNWGLLLPEFRGPNLTTNVRTLDAAGLMLAKQDVMDAIDRTCQHHAIDDSCLFLLGGSGGGHMALMFAGDQPHRFTAISSWCPITDLALWHDQNPNYQSHIAAVCGGCPGEGAEVDARYRDKSPMNYIKTIAQANLSVHHGRYDLSVPFTHTVSLASAIEAFKPKKFHGKIFDGGHELRYNQALAWFDQFLSSPLDDGRRLTA